MKKVVLLLGLLPLISHGRIMFKLYEPSFCWGGKPYVRVLAKSTRSEPKTNLKVTILYVEYSTKGRYYLLKDKETVSGTVEYSKNGTTFKGKYIPKPKKVKGKSIPKKYYLAASEKGLVGESFLKSRYEKIKDFTVGTKFKRDGSVIKE